MAIDQMFSFCIMATLFIWRNILKLIRFSLFSAGLFCLFLLGCGIQQHARSTSPKRNDDYPFFKGESTTSGANSEEQEKQASKIVEAKKNLDAALKDFEQGRFDHAEKKFSKARGIYQSINDINAEAVALLGLGSIHYCRAEFDEAIKLFEKAEAMVLSTGDAHGNLSLVLSELGFTYLQLDQYERASNLLDMAYDLDKSSQQQDYKKLADDIMYKGVALWKTGKYRDAVAHFNLALKTYQKMPDFNETVTAPCLANLGTTWQDLGEYKEAIKILEKASALDEKNNNESQQTATIFSMLGTSWLGLGDRKKALKYFEKGLEISKRILGDSHPDVAIGLKNIGLVLIEEKQYQQAKKYLDEAIEIDLKVYGKNHSMIANGLINQGTLYGQQKEYSLAISNFEQAISIIESIHGFEHPNLVIPLSNLGTIHIQQRHHKEALRCLDRAQEIAQKSYNGDHPNIAIVMTHYGLYWASRGNLNKAEKVWEEALLMIKKFVNDNHQHVQEIEKLLQRVRKAKRGQM